MKTLKFSLVLRIRENTDVFITLDENIYGIHNKRVNILSVITSFAHWAFQYYLKITDAPDVYDSTLQALQRKLTYDKKLSEVTKILPVIILFTRFDYLRVVRSLPKYWIHRLRFSLWWGINRNLLAGYQKRCHNSM